MSKSSKHTAPAAFSTEELFRERSRCGGISDADIDREVTLAGWADTIRDHGGIIFIELRDISGKMQVVFDQSISMETFKTAESIRSEWVIIVKGNVRMRSDETVNPSLLTGYVEVAATFLEILSCSAPLPFPIDSGALIGEEVRLKYRYLDLRRREMRDAVIARHRVMQEARCRLTQMDFLEIETPVLNKSTPEGARDFLVPSRLARGMFYALPQSPQLFKQILMTAGYDRYFQIVKCFRDEDLRNDRQPEFTQIDMELSFVTPAMVMGITEELIAGIVREILGLGMATPFRRLTFDQSMEKYCTDAPDLRIGIEVSNVTDIFTGSGFNVFSRNLSLGGVIKGFAVPDDPRLSRVVTDGYSEFVKQFGAGGFPNCRYADGKLSGGIAKFISDREREKLIERFRLMAPSFLFFSSDREGIVNLTMSHMRKKVAQDLSMIDDGALEFVWITDFPLFEFSDKEGRFQSVHHPFTAPHPEQIESLQGITPEKAGSIKAQSYDIVLNGSEIGGGSIRIHDPELQRRIFAILGISPAEAEERFSFLLDALTYGAPPHGGIALGLDRMLMMLLRRSSIREVIPFPKTQKGQCLMSGSPGMVDARQLRDLSIRPVG